jgi:hypothetical protein
VSRRERRRETKRTTEQGKRERVIGVRRSKESIVGKRDKNKERKIWKERERERESAERT